MRAPDGILYFGIFHRKERSLKTHTANCFHLRRKLFVRLSGSEKITWVEQMPWRPSIFRPNSLNFRNASAFPVASSTGLCVCAVTRYFFHSVAFEASLTKPA